MISKKPINRQCIISCLLIAVSLWSCKKTIIQEDAASGTKPFAQLSVSNNFSWTNSRTVTVTIQGLPTINSVSGTLTLKTADGRGVLYNGFHRMNQDLVLQIVVPSAQDSVLLQFGTVQKKFSVRTNAATANYLPTIEADTP